METSVGPDADEAARSLEADAAISVVRADGSPPVMTVAEISDYILCRTPLPKKAIGQTSEELSENRRALTLGSMTRLHSGGARARMTIAG